MAASAESIRGRLYNVAKDENIIFQDLLQRYGSEQFLARLAVSPYADRFIFKGGSLLAYLIDTERQTKDLDFSIRSISNKVEDCVKIIQHILEINLDDGLQWSQPEGSVLAHPEMDYPGVRIKCGFVFANARGMIHMDLALGDLVESKMTRPEIYVSTDVEADGPIPGANSMLSFASAAYLEDKTLLASFSVNLKPLPHAVPDPKTMQWWQSQPEAYQACLKNQKQPQEAMADYLAWLKGLPGVPVLPFKSCIKKAFYFIFGA